MQIQIKEQQNKQEEILYGRYQEYKFGEMELLPWLHSMKESMEKEKKPTSLAEAESILSVHEKRKTELDTCNAALLATSKTGEQILAAGISSPFREQLKKSLDLLRMVMLYFESIQLLHTHS